MPAAQLVKTRVANTHAQVCSPSLGENHKFTLMRPHWGPLRYNTACMHSLAVVGVGSLQQCIQQLVGWVLHVRKAIQAVCNKLTITLPGQQLVTTQLVQQLQHGTTAAAAAAAAVAAAMATAAAAAAVAVGTRSL